MNKTPFKFATGKLAPVNRVSVSFGDFLKVMPTVPLVDMAPDLVYPMDGNDRVGDCVIAGWDHFRQTVTYLLTGTGLNFTQDQLWKFYQTQNPKFDPNGSSTTNGPGSQYDCGMSEQLFLEWLATNKYILGFGQVTLMNEQLLRAAIYIGLGVIIGVQLQEAQQNQFATGKWDFVPGSPTEGGHCIDIVGFDTTTELYEIITWGAKIKCTWNFLAHQMDEAWFVITQYHVDHPGFRNHFDLSAFADAVSTITGGKIVIPVTVPITFPYAFSRTLKLGMSGDDVKAVQTALGLMVDGSFGPETQAAVIAFQKAHGLTQDGIVGTKTQAAINANAPATFHPMLDKWCKAAQQYEGWSVIPPSRSYLNNNPGNIEFTGQSNAALETGHNPNRFAHFMTYQDGYNSLYNLFLNACTGKSSVYYPTMTLQDFYGVYAPSVDGNNVSAYATFVAGFLGVPVTTQIKTFL